MVLAAAVIVIAFAVPAAGQGRGWTGAHVCHQTLGRDAPGPGVHLRRV